MALGLDIGSKTIKVIELTRERNSYRLKASGIFGYNGKPPDLIESDKEAFELATAIRKLVKEARVSSKEVNIALPEFQVYTRTVKYPLLTDSEIASAIEWEAEQYIPIPKKEAIIDHQVLERREDASPPQVLVLLVATPKQVVERYIKVIEMAGLRVNFVETELFSLVRALAPADKTVIIVDFGARSTDIAVAKNGVLYFTRSITTAGQVLTRTLSKTLDIEEKQAEEYKKAYGLSSQRLEGKIREILEPIVRIVSDEIKKTIQFYSSEQKGEKPQGVIITGGSSAMFEVTNFFAKDLGLEIVVGNPFANIEAESSVKKILSDYVNYYSVAVGLAMREE